MGHKTKGLRKNFYRDRQRRDYEKQDGILNTAKEYANLAYLIGIFGKIPSYVARMEEIYKSNAYVRSVLEYHPDPLLAISGRFRGDPDRNSDQDPYRGGMQSERDWNANGGGSRAEKETIGVFHFAP